MKLIDFLREFKYVEPRDEAHYRELMKALQDIQNNPDQYAQVGKMNFMKRKAALDAWADANLPKSEDGVQPTDMKRMGAMGKTLYVHKDGKTIMIPAEREKDFIQKGFKRSALRTEDQVDERMPASVIKHKEKLAHMSDEELAKHFQDKDDETLKQMAWRHGYGKMSDYYVNRKNKGMSQDTNEGEMRMDKSAFVQMLANKIQEPQKGHGRPEYDNRLLAKMYKLITGKDVDFEGNKFTITMNKPTTEDIDEKGRIALEKAGFDPSKVKEYLAVFNDHGDTSDVDQMNMDKVGLADAMSMVLASHDIKNESTNEGTYLDEGWLDTLKAAGRKIVPDQIKALYDPATAAKVQADDQAKVQTQTLYKDIVTVAGLNQTDVSQGYPADLIVAYLRKYVAPRHPDAFSRMDNQGDLKKFFPAGSKISPGTLKANLNKVAIELGKISLKSPGEQPGQQTGQQTGQQPQPQMTSIDNDDSVKEGASMIPYFKTEKDFDGEKTTVYEFPMAWAKDKELDTPYLSNASMREFLTGLGYSGDFENMSAVPVDEFIGVSTQWLKKNIGKQSPEEPTTIDKNPDGPTMISGGKPEGYMNQQVKLHNELARKIKSKYPEVTHLGFN